MTSEQPGRGERRYHPLFELTRARVVEFVREPEAVFWVFVFPVLLALALGIAFRNKPVDQVQVGLLAGGNPVAVELAGALEEDRHLAVQFLDPDLAAEALRKGRVDVVVDLRRLDAARVDGDTPASPGEPDDRGTDGSAGPGSGTDGGETDEHPGLRGRTDGGAVAYRYDPDRAEGRIARLAVDDALQRAMGRRDPAATEDLTDVQAGSRYIDFLIPGLVGLNLMGSGMWGIGFTVVVSRTKKLLKRFAATPMKRSHYLASFALSRLVFLILEVGAVVGFGRLIFGVRVHGSLFALALVALIGAGCFAGIGLLVAARPRTVEAVSGWMNLVMLPMWLLSGTFFSYERFPAQALPAIRALPLTALNDALRAVVNDGAPLWSIWPQVLIMAAWGLVSFAVAVRVFRWQ